MTESTKTNQPEGTFRSSGRISKQQSNSEEAKGLKGPACFEIEEAGQEGAWAIVCSPQGRQTDIKVTL